MTQATQMLDTYPADLGGVDREALARCIDECCSYAQACTACADACLSEDNVADLTKCIRSDLDSCFANDDRTWVHGAPTGRPRPWRLRPVRRCGSR